MVKIKDIAEKCGLSVASVSKALHGKPDISPKTVELVQQTAKEMGYIPNSSAVNLKTNHSYMIGVLIFDEIGFGLAHEYFSNMLNAIREEARRCGYDIVFISDRIGAEKCTFLEHARYRNCEGVILVSADYNSKQVIDLVESPLPTVTIDYDFNDHSSVNSDNIQGMKDIVNYIHDMGHTNIAFIHGESTSVTKKRVKSFYKACSQCGITLNEEFVIEGKYNTPKISGQLTRKILASKNRPTCIIYPDDYALLGGLTEIEKHGLKVPDDISVVGYDGILLSRMMRPIFTTYVQNEEEMAIRAIRKLIEIIDDPKTSLPERISVKGTLQIGQTVKKIK